MKIFIKKFNHISVVILVVLFIFGLFNPSAASAATSPSLGTVGNLGVLSSTFTNSNTSPQTIINGEVCFTTGPVTPPLSITGTTSTPCPPQTGIDQGSVQADLNSQACISLGAGAVTLDSVVVGANPPGTFPPGCYSSGGVMNITSTTNVTLNGAGTYIFKPGGALNTGANSNVVLAGGACASDVFWAPVGAVTIGANASLSPTPTFAGNILSAAGITLGHFANLTGRALSFGGTVTTDANTITVPTCVSAPVTPPATNFHFLKRICPSWSVLAGNARAQRFDITGHFTEFTNYVASIPNFPAIYSPKPVNPAEIVGSCVPAPGWNFTLATDEAQTQNIFTAGPTNSSGEVVVPFSSLNAAAQQTLLSGSELWVSENPQSGFPFAALRCYNDANNGDNKESILFDGPAPADVYCIAYNVDLSAAGPASSINVVKVVVNDNGGAETIADFPLFVNGTPVVSGVTNTFPANAAYTVTETSSGNYTQTFSGDCDSSGHLSLIPGDIKICIITNDDIAPVVDPSVSRSSGGGSSSVVPPLMDLVKIPNPLSLPDGSGPVTYTYTLRNIGTVPVTDITMVGDTCSPISLASGDIDNDEKLDVNEVWVYTCSTTLTATHTNIVTATGWANGISAVDVASATVVVGVPVLPPLIHVTKVPSPLALPIGGGMITYTNIVTNPGIAALTDVHLTDDKCSPVNYISGDINGNSMLDNTESWIYTCQTRITKTTTNTIIAEADSSGTAARDFAIATVVVSVPGFPTTGFVPGLPNTGLSPDGQSPPWNIVFPAEILVVLLSLYAGRRKLII